jgi:hypothetical protein
MKNLILILFFLVSFAFTACNEDFSPKTDLAENYVLYSVIQTVDSNQYDPKQYTVSASIAKTYSIDGYDASSSSIDPVVEGAVVTFQDHGSHILTGEKVKSPAGYKYGDWQYVYSGSDLKVLEQDTITLSAKLPNGKILSAGTKILSGLSLAFSYPVTADFTTQIIRFIWGEALTVSWSSKNTSHLFFPRFWINYTKKENGVEVFHTKDVPMKYLNINGKQEAVYPSYQRDTLCSFDFAAIDTAMAQIAGNDVEKSNYWIKSFSIGVVEFDAPLSNYYSSLYGYTDRFSIVVDESVYTNVTGGIGVVGSSRQTSLLDLPFKNAYIELFGYSYGTGK